MKLTISQETISFFVKNIRIKIIEITKDIYPPKGRCEIIKVNKGVAVIDYAHTPDAVEKVINSFNELKQNRVITIVGCGGDRDRTKRPIMGDIACKLSDHVIFTNDNPRTEDPNQIMNDIVKDLKYKDIVELWGDENFRIVLQDEYDTYEDTNEFVTSEDSDYYTFDMITKIWREDDKGNYILIYKKDKE